MIIIGLTGSIGMGKSTTAALFAEKNIPVYDADKAVHDLYENELVPHVATLFPDVIIENKVDRSALSKRVLGDEQAMKQLEAIVHPAVQDREQKFLQQASKEKAPMVILDIPLLFETGKWKKVDRVVVVTAPAEIQRERVLSRPDMTLEKFQSILARQTPDSEKREKADFIIHTDKGLEDARKQVDEIIRSLLQQTDVT